MSAGWHPLDIRTNSQTIDLSKKKKKTWTAVKETTEAETGHLVA
jgi:hypothetical protein